MTTVEMVFWYANAASEYGYDRIWAEVSEGMAALFDHHLTNAGSDREPIKLGAHTLMTMSPDGSEESVVKQGWGFFAADLIDGLWVDRRCWHAPKVEHP
mgnify:CR=1 FL=1